MLFVFSKYPVSIRSLKADLSWLNSFKYWISCFLHWIHNMKPGKWLSSKEYTFRLKSKIRFNMHQNETKEDLGYSCDRARNEAGRDLRWNWNGVEKSNYIVCVSKVLFWNYGYDSAVVLDWKLINTLSTSVLTKNIKLKQTKKIFTIYNRWSVLYIYQPKLKNSLKPENNTILPSWKESLQKMY